MSRLLFIAFLAVLGSGLAPGSAHANRYGWTLSSSSTNPFSNQGSATLGITTLYLWLQCSEPDGMAAAEFDLSGSQLSILAVTPENGFLNAGGADSPLLAVGGCESGPVVAATVLVLDNPGTLCFVPSARSGILGTVDCEVTPRLHEMEWIGYSNDGQAPCSEGKLCRAEFVRDASWSEIKGLYRR